MDKRQKATTCVNSRCGAFSGKVIHQFYCNLTGFMCGSGIWKNSKAHRRGQRCSCLLGSVIKNSAQERLMCEQPLKKLSD